MKRFIRYILSIILLVFVFISGWYAAQHFTKVETKDIPTPFVEKLRPLEKYTIANLSKNKNVSAQIDIGETLAEEDEYTSYSFSMKFDPTFSEGKQKSVTGVLNIPTDTEKAPLVVMIRGFVSQEIYTPGMGTKNAAAYFAENGYITIAPDFLGFGDSDSESSNIFETRFQTYTTMVALLNSLDEIEQWDNEHKFIWAHSNGGQIALTASVILEHDIPTTLWAPVTKPFPFSILYYTDEAPDEGKYLRTTLAKFEEDYDVDNFNFTNHLEEISSPIQIHQGTADDAIPVEWSRSFVAKMERIEKEIELYTYSGADHNLRPSWDAVVERDVTFFNSFLDSKE